MQFQNSYGQGKQQLSPNVQRAAQINNTSKQIQQNLNKNSLIPSTSNHSINSMTNTNFNSPNSNHTSSTSNHNNHNNHNSSLRPPSDPRDMLNPEYANYVNYKEYNSSQGLTNDSGINSMTMTLEKSRSKSVDILDDQTNTSNSISPTSPGQITGSSGNSNVQVVTTSNVQHANYASLFKQPAPPPLPANPPRPVSMYNNEGRGSQSLQGQGGYNNLQRNSMAGSVNFSLGPATPSTAGVPTPNSNASRKSLGYPPQQQNPFEFQRSYSSITPSQGFKYNNNNHHHNHNITHKASTTSLQTPSINLLADDFPDKTAGRNPSKRYEREMEVDVNPSNLAKSRLLSASSMLSIYSMCENSESVSTSKSKKGRRGLLRSASKIFSKKNRQNKQFQSMDSIAKNGNGSGLERCQSDLSNASVSSHSRQYEKKGGLFRNMFRSKKKSVDSVEFSYSGAEKVNVQPGANLRYLWGNF